MLRYLSLIVLSFLSVSSFAQEIPAGSCGLLMTYDAAGNRTKREYYCNNSGGRIALSEIANQEEAVTGDFTSVDALYPNPTTGRFYITFTRPLDNAVIQINDINGRLIQRVKAAGTKLELDLSKQPAGTYFVLINSNGLQISKKVIKSN